MSRIFLPAIFLLAACRQEETKPEALDDTGSTVNLSDDSGHSDDSSATDDSHSPRESQDSQDSQDSAPDSMDSQGSEDCIQEFPSGDWNILVLGEFHGTGKVGGRLAGRDIVDISNFEVAASDPGGVAITGAVLSLSNGLAYGDILYETSYTATADVGLTGTLSQGSALDWMQMELDLHHLSAQLARSPTNGTTTVQSWMEINLEGTDPSTNVFSVNAADVSAAVKMTLTVPDGSTSIINISVYDIT